MLNKRSGNVQWKINTSYRRSGKVWEICNTCESCTFILFNSPTQNPVFSSHTRPFLYSFLGFFWLSHLCLHKMGGLHSITGKFLLGYKMLLLFAAPSTSKYLIFFFKVILINQFFHYKATSKLPPPNQR